MTEVGIIGYGAYVPRYRILAEEIARVWGGDAERIKNGLRLQEKSVPGPDEDTATIAVEAARNALKRANIDPTKINAVYVGSETHPYVVKPTATVVAEAIGATPKIMAADYEFACKAGTAAIQTLVGLVGAKRIKYGLAIGADTSTGAPGDELEYSAAAGGAAFVIGENSRDVVALIIDTYSITTDTPDFWRREHQPYPRHAERFTGSPAYFRHVSAAAHGLMEELGTSSQDYDYVVFHQPNGKFPVKAAECLGFSPPQYKPGLIVSELGNTYSGSSLIGLASVLDIAESGDRILLVSYGSGAGSDAFDLLVEDGVGNHRNNAPLVREFLEKKVYIDYATYAKFCKKVRMA